MTPAAPAVPVPSVSPSPPPLELSLRRGLSPLARRVEERDGFPVLPGGFPLVGHMPATALDELGLLRDAERSLGPMFFWNQGFGAFQLVCTARDAFSLFKNKVTDSEYMLTHQGLAHLFGAGLIARDGAEHRHLRTAMNGPFQPRGLGEAKVGELVASLVDARVRSWVGAGRGDVRILAETRELALEVMFRLVGVDEHEIGAWRHRYERLMLLALNFPFDLPGTPRRRGLEARAWLDERIGRIVTRVRARGAEEQGILPALLRSRDETGAPLSDRELVDNLRLVFLAGHETSASTMAWMVAHLAEEPAVWRALRDEARAAPDLPRSPRDLKQFPHAEAVFRETLRLHPPVAHDARRAIVDFELGGRTVKKGTLCTIPILTLSRDAEQYPDPDTFRPARWIGKQEALSPLEMVQFGGGPHFCLGYHLAWMEIVAFAVALGRALPASGPRLVGPFPAPRYLPLLHPAASTMVRFDGR